MQPAQCMLLFLVLAGIPLCFDFYVVTRSYSSRLFLYALVLICSCEWLASFTGPAQLSIAFSTEKRFSFAQGNLGMKLVSTVAALSPGPKSPTQVSVTCEHNAQNAEDIPVRDERILTKHRVIYMSCYLGSTGGGCAFCSGPAQGGRCHRNQSQVH